jgi:hypothetical protein
MNQQKKKKKHKNPTITNGTHLHHLHHLHAHQHFVVEQDRQRERTPTLALRIICEPIVNVGKLIKENTDRERDGVGGVGMGGLRVFSSEVPAWRGRWRSGLGIVRVFSSPPIQFL